MEYSMESKSKSPQKRTGRPNKREIKNTLFHYFKRSPSKKSQKLQKEPDIMDEEMPVTRKTHDMSDGSSGEEGERQRTLDIALMAPPAEPMLTSSKEVPTKEATPEEPTPKETFTKDLFPNAASPTAVGPKGKSRLTKIRLSQAGRGWTRYCDRDTAEYRKGYPKKKDSPNKRKNELFYTNMIPSRPRGGYIDDILRDWHGDYTRLEAHHGYIQWLFPIREEGVNIESQELQLHEAEAIRADAKAHARVLKAYQMMLHFYGMRLKDAETGELEREDNWKIRYKNLRESYHNYLRITRILKSLGELGYEHLKAPFVQFTLHEALLEGALEPVLESALNFWVNTIKDDTSRQQLKDYAQQFIEDG